MKKKAMVAIRRLLPAGLVLLIGCSLPGYSKVDEELQALRVATELPSPARTVDAFPTSPAPSRVAAAFDMATASASSGPTAPPTQGVTRVAYQPTERTDPPPKDESMKPPDRLPVPPGLPGADAPPIPRVTADMSPAEREKKLAAFYPPTEPLPLEPPPAPGPEGHPMTLADLQRLGETYSPAVKNAQAAVDAAKGAAIQSGMYPNPTFSFENDTIQTGPAGYPGFFIDQVIKTGGKLKVLQAAALMDVLNAKAALRRAQTDLSYAVRGAYFAVLVARENVRINEALFKFSEDIYRYQVAGVVRARVGFSAAYEPLQLEALVMGARLAVVQARNQYHASWRQLAAALGLPCMPPSELAGRVDMPVPVFDYQQVLEHMSRNHTDVITAENNIRKAKYNLASAKLVPLPDVDARVLVQKDYSTPPNQIAASVQVSIPVPIWDQNKGAIRQAEAQLAQALVGPDQARNTLINTLADAYNRYDTGRMSVKVTANQVKVQLLAYRGLRARREADPTSVGFGDLVTAQQTLASYITGYLTSLGAQWQAVVDVANVLQTDDLFQAAPSQEMLLIPDLKDLELGPHPKHAASAGADELKNHGDSSTVLIRAHWVDANSPGTQPAPWPPR